MYDNRIKTVLLDTRKGTTGNSTRTYELKFTGARVNELE